jgi:hypothetical protein
MCGHHQDQDHDQQSKTPQRDNPKRVISSLELNI